MTTHTTGTIDSNMRLPSLDGLRGVAIALVLMHSLTVLEVTNSLPSYLLNFAFNVGWVGVQLFFVLSGFLITGILLDTRRSANYFKSFFGRRVLRIFPLYYGTLVIAFILLPAVGAAPAALQNDGEHQIWFWFYLSNWYTGAVQGFPHYWSLAVEEQFYLLWPLLVYRCSPKWLLKVCIGLAVASFIIRIGLRWDGVSPDLIYISSFCRMDALALGAAVAVIVREPALFARLRERTTAILVSAVLIVLPVAVLTRGFERTSFYGQTIGYSTLSIAFALVVLAAALGDDRELTAGWRAVLTSRLLRTLGKYSYGMYVFQRPLHKFVGEPLIHMLPFAVSSSPVWDVVYVITMSAVTLCLAMFSFRFIETPFLKLKDRFVAQGPLDANTQPARVLP